MRYAYLLALVAAAVTGLSISQHQQKALQEQVPVSQEKFLIELQPGETRWVTEDEKWALRRVRPLISMPTARC
jgi:bacterial leucyl aminopeptidase